MLRAVLSRSAAAAPAAANATPASTPATLAAATRTYMRGLDHSPSRKAQAQHDLYSSTHPEYVRHDALLAQTTNLIMRHGKKAQAARLLTDALDHVRTLTNTPGSGLPARADPADLFAEAVARTAPLLETKAFKRGNKVLQIPKALNERQRNRRGITWILDAAGKRSDKEFGKRLGNEIAAVLDGTSEAVKRKDQLYKLALANRANVAVKMNI
ncbi:hypothetical protein GGF32_007822 [Allomyces javanicus]|nr:hypothetical protein GGF32_007822 [Allomyces javanicus]